MSNVIPFPPKKNEDKELSEEEGGGWNSGEFTQWLERSAAHPFIKEIVGKLPHSPYLNDYPDCFWEYSDWCFSKDRVVDLDVFCLATTWREKMVPSFGIQGHRHYTGVSFGWAEDSEGFTEVPNTLLHDLEAYFSSHRDSADVNNQICFALLAALLERPETRLVHAGCLEDQYVVHFCHHEAVNGQRFQYVFWADFLPLLLDGAATRYAVEKGLPLGPQH